MARENSNCAWSAAPRDDVREPRAFLVRTTTRLAIDRLRQLQTRREAYIGPWLPEPLVTDFGPAVPDTAERAVLADSVSVAVLVVLESLSPLERAVFVLHEVFGYTCAEIAGMLDRSEAAVRQVASRARAHVQARRPRYDAPADTRRATADGRDSFAPACRCGASAIHTLRSRGDNRRG